MLEWLCNAILTVYRLIRNHSIFVSPTVLESGLIGEPIQASRSSTRPYWRTPRLFVSSSHHDYLPDTELPQRRYSHRKRVT
jgi:hypothetical protein